MDHSACNSAAAQSCFRLYFLKRNQMTCGCGNRALMTAVEIHFPFCYIVHAANDRDGTFRF